jgi:hypothetical protein
MAYSLEILDNPRGSYVQVTVTGPLRTDITAVIVSQAVETGRTAGLTRALFDLRKTWMEDTFLDVHAFMEGLGALGVAYGDQVAIVYENDADRHRHAENVAFNRGFSQIRYFQEIDLAREWLDGLC